MKKITILILTIILVLLASCSTSMKINYVQPSNINMGSYRNIAIASATKYSGSNRTPLYIRLEITDENIPLYTYLTTYDFSFINNEARDEVTRMVTRLFSSSGYYSVMNPNKTDAYLDLYKYGKNPSQMLEEEGVDAIIIPKITSFNNDEFISAMMVVNEDGSKTPRYYINRSVEIAVTITVLDIHSDKIVAIKEYRGGDSEREIFDPKTATFFYSAQRDLVRNAISSMYSSIVADFIPTSRSTSIELMSNKPKNENVIEAYDAAKDGNFNYALELFKNAWDREGHIPSGYNAALIMASRGDLESALEYLNEIRSLVNDKNVNKLYVRIKDLKDKNDKAREQYMPQSESSSSGVNVSPYEFLLN